MTLSAAYGSGGGGEGTSLTGSQKDTLKYLEYNETSNMIEASRTIATEASTVRIGNHGLSSGGENFIFKNNSSDITWFPPWTGVKSQSVTDNIDETGIITPTVRHYTSDLLEFEVAGAPHASAIVGYSKTNPVAASAAIFIQEVILGEALEINDWLKYEVRVGTETDPVIYQQLISETSLDIGDTFSWAFTNALEGREGLTITSTLKIAKGSQDATYNLLQVRAAASDPTTRYVKSFFRTFEDEDLISGTLYTNTDTVIRYPSTYAVDTSGGEVELVVNNDVGYKTFNVFDANNTFATSPCVVMFGAGQGSLILSEDGSNYSFYWDGDLWRYLKHTNSFGDVVPTSVVPNLPDLPFVPALRSINSIPNNGEILLDTPLVFSDKFDITFHMATGDEGIWHILNSNSPAKWLMCQGGVFHYYDGSASTSFGNTPVNDFKHRKIRFKKDDNSDIRLFQIDNDTQAEVQLGNTINDVGTFQIGRLGCGVATTGNEVGTYLWDITLKGTGVPIINIPLNEDLVSDSILRDFVGNAIGTYTGMTTADTEIFDCQDNKTCFGEDIITQTIWENPNIANSHWTFANDKWTIDSDASYSVLRFIPEDDQPARFYLKIPVDSFSGGVDSVMTATSQTGYTDISTAGDKVFEVLLGEQGRNEFKRSGTSSFISILSKYSMGNMIQEAAMPT